MRSPYNVYSPLKPNFVKKSVYRKTEKQRCWLLIKGHRFPRKGASEMAVRAKGTVKERPRRIWRHNFGRSRLPRCFSSVEARDGAFARGRSSESGPSRRGPRHRDDAVLKPVTWYLAHGRAKTGRGTEEKGRRTVKIMFRERH